MESPLSTCQSTFVRGQAEDLGVEKELQKLNIYY